MKLLTVFGIDNAVFYLITVIVFGVATYWFLVSNDKSGKKPIDTAQFWYGVLLLLAYLCFLAYIKIHN